jgi:phosphoglycerate dehydrogenase-like enzyme
MFTSEPSTGNDRTTKILIASAIDPDAIEALRKRYHVTCALNAREEVLQSLIKDRKVLIFRSGVSITADVMACAPDLRLLVRAGSGLDNLDVEFVRDRKLKLVRIPEPGARAVAELTFGLMLALARQVLVADRLLRQGRWAKYELSGHLLAGKVLGIVGTGNIGSRVGQMGAAWDMNVIGCVEYPSPSVAARLREKGIRLTHCQEVLATADFVSVHVPLKNSTRNLIGVEALSRMKPGAFLLNLARGGVVDEGALYQALREGRLAGAALDVHVEEGEGKISPLARLPNVVLTPHIGAMTIDSQREIGRRVVEIVDGFVMEQVRTRGSKRKMASTRLAVARGAQEDG